MSDNCFACNEPLGEFRDEASQREASLSELCQGCQDDYFGPEPKVEKNASNQSTGSFEPPAPVEEEDKLPEWIREAQKELG